MTLVIANQCIYEASIDFAVRGFMDRVVAAILANCAAEVLKSLPVRIVDGEEQYLHF